MGGMEDYYIAQFFCWREIILLNLEIDIETFSSVNLAKAGVYRYAESPDFEVLLFGYSVDGGEVKVQLNGGKVQRYIHPCLLSFMLVFLNILNCQMK